MTEEVHKASPPSPFTHTAYLFVRTGVRKGKVYGYWKGVPGEKLSTIAGIEAGTLSLFDTTSALNFRLKLDKGDDTTRRFYEYVLDGCAIGCSTNFGLLKEDELASYEAVPHFPAGTPPYDIVWNDRKHCYIKTWRRCTVTKLYFFLYRE